MSVNKKVFNDFIQDRGQYATIPNELWELPGLELTAKCIWCYVLSRSPNWSSSRNNVAKNLGIHPTTASKYLRQLEDRRLLRIRPNVDGSGWDFEILPPVEWVRVFNEPPPGFDPMSDSGKGVDQNGSGSASDPVVDQPVIHTQEATRMREDERDLKEEVFISNDSILKPITPAKDPVGADTGLGHKNSEPDPERALLELLDLIDEARRQQKYLGPIRDLVQHYVSEYGEDAIIFDRIRERIEFSFPARRKHKEARESCSNCIETAREAHILGQSRFRLEQMRKAQPEFVQPERKPLILKRQPLEIQETPPTDEDFPAPDSGVFRYTVDQSEYFTRIYDLNEEINALNQKLSETLDPQLKSEIAERILNKGAELEKLEKESLELTRQNQARRDLERGQK